MLDPQNENPAPSGNGNRAHSQGLNASENTRTESKGQWTFARLSVVAIFDPALSHAALRVLASFATYANETGICRPAVTTIAARLGVTRRAIQQHMRHLEAAGYLATVRTQREKGGFGTNTYQLRFPAAATPENLAKESAADADQGMGSGFDPIPLESDDSPIARDAKRDFASNETGETDVKPGFTSGERCEAPLHGGAKPGFTGGAKPHFARTIPMNETRERERDSPLTPHSEVASAFDRFCEANPKSRIKPVIRRSWDQAIADGADPEALIEAMIEHVRSTEPRYVKQPHNWLDQRCWLSEPMTSSKSPAGFDFAAFVREG